MELQKINDILSELSEYSLGRKFKQIHSSTSKGYESEKSQGEEGEKTVVYDIGEQDVFLKIVFTSDSYGEENGITSIKFAKAEKKEITVYG